MLAVSPQASKSQIDIVNDTEAEAAAPALIN